MISSLCSFLKADSESAKIINKTNFSYLLQAVSVFYLQKHLHAMVFKVPYFPYWWQKNNKKSKKYCEQFSKFFTEISTNIQSKISPTRKSYTDYLLNQNSETFLITPTTDEGYLTQFLTSTLGKVQDLTAYQQK